MPLPVSCMKSSMSLEVTMGTGEAAPMIKSRDTIQVAMSGV